MDGIVEKYNSEFYPFEVKIVSEKGGLFRLKLPFKTFYIQDVSKKYSLKEDNILEIKMKAGEKVVVKNGYE